jgi:hypothetical protein
MLIRDRFVNDHTKNNPKQSKIIRSPKPNSKIPYLLKGLMRCECCNSILSPTYTTKKSGVVYRYYKPNKLMKHAVNSETNKECQLASVPAEQIENIVLNQIYGILRDPSMVNKMIEYVKDTSVGDINITEQEVINCLKNIEVVWDELFPREKIKMVRTLIKEIIVSRTNVKITFNELGFVQLISEAGDGKTVNAITDGGVTTGDAFSVNIPIELNYRSGRSIITAPDGRDIILKNTQSKKTISKNWVDSSLLNNLIQAEDWKKELSNNPSMNINTIAKREHKENSYICRVLDLIFLAPDIKKSILDGKTPTGLSFKDTRTVVGLDWKGQRRKLRIEN